MYPDNDGDNDDQSESFNIGCGEDLFYNVMRLLQINSRCQTKWVDV